MRADNVHPEGYARARADDGPNVFRHAHAVSDGDVEDLYCCRMVGNDVYCRHDVIPGDEWVTGVTSLGDDMFVVRVYIQQIEVHSAVTFTLQGRRDLVFHPVWQRAPATSACLYVSDFHNHLVGLHRVKLSGRNAVAKWLVGPRPAGLTVNSEKNLAVVIRGECKLKESTTHGALYRRPFNL